MKVVSKSVSAISASFLDQSVFLDNRIVSEAQVSDRDYWEDVIKGNRLASGSLACRCSSVDEELYVYSRRMIRRLLKSSLYF